MVDTGRLASLLERMAAELAALRSLARRDAADLVADDVALPAAKYRLVMATEAAIDACEHVIASEGYRASGDYADAFRVLVEEQVLPAELGGRLQDAARFRNLLVHGYADVDDARVVTILQTRLGDLTQFGAHVAAAFLEAD
ncbi:MAG TPA: DUF86 domain-containing protein [Egibacteraceae bacterium]|nr:DUF86 domain-containing protein [Egibacteraceae bacterium]